MAGRLTAAMWSNRSERSKVKPRDLLAGTPINFRTWIGRRATSECEGPRLCRPLNCRVLAIGRSFCASVIEHEPNPIALVGGLRNDRTRDASRHAEHEFLATTFFPRYYVVCMLSKTNRKNNGRPRGPWNGSRVMSIGSASEQNLVAPLSPYDGVCHYGQRWHCMHHARTSSDRMSC